MIIQEEDYLAHVGTPRHSGRYPWGSGGNTPRRNKRFLDYLNEMRRQGMGDTDIAKAIGVESGEKFSTARLRAMNTIALNEKKQASIATAERLRAKGMSLNAIATRMNLPGESSVRALLAPGAKDRADVLLTTAKMLKDQVAEKKMIQIGTGVENHIGVAETKLKASVAILKEEGYQVYYLKVPQQGTGKDTSLKVLCAPGITYSEAYKNRDNIKLPFPSSDDQGRTFTGNLGILPPIQIHPNRVGIVYGDQGGSKADGVIYVRPGVKDLGMGEASYAQVRIAVGDGHYLKGMAMYKSDMPDGVDLLFNTVKKDTGNKLDALKPNETDADNPFGSTVRQLIEKDAHGNEKLTSAMNIIYSEGKWEEWSNNLSSQFLSKQSPKLAKAQLDKTYQSKVKDFEEISALTNPAVRRKLLKTFSDGADASAVHLKAAALPHQGNHVILPITSMAPTQVYAPNYADGERVALIRFPHGGTFEIPDLVVNNRHPEAKRVLGQARDAIGIHPSVAERLSGADFDGDTVLVIPNGSNKIKITPALEHLKNFDPKSEYPEYPGMVPMSKGAKGQHMGDVSNLITDMTIRKASPNEMARAIKHSMVVIDAAKHKLNYKQSAIDNNIAQLKAKYQGGSTAGAATLLSRRKGLQYVPERKDRPAAKGGPIDPATGKRVYEYTGRTYTNAKGKVVVKQDRSVKLAETDDAHTLSSKVETPIEYIYAEHSNRLKALANAARKELVSTPSMHVSTSAKKVYAAELASLNGKLDQIVRNRPLERQAQIIASMIVKQKKDGNPNLEDDQLKKIQYQALTVGRIRAGATKQKVIITPEEWEAIQAGALSENKLQQILEKADLDVVRQLATPRPDILMTPSNTHRAKALLAQGLTRGEVAAALGVSLSTLDKSTNV